MTEQITEQIPRVVVKFTKAGNGVKLRLPNGQWLYASKRQFFDMTNGRASACSFVPIDAPNAPSVESADDGSEW